jgi:hypothetical protein
MNPQTHFPHFQESGPPKNNLMSKGGILARACDFIKELKDTNRNLISRLGSGSGMAARDVDTMRLQRQVRQKPNFCAGAQRRVARFFLVQHTKMGKNIPNT